MLLLFLPKSGMSNQLKSPDPLSPVPGLNAFISRFGTRVVEMALDVDEETATVAIVIATVLLRFFYHYDVLFYFCRHKKLSEKDVEAIIAIITLHDSNLGDPTLQAPTLQAPAFDVRSKSSKIASSSTYYLSYPRRKALGVFLSCYLMLNKENLSDFHSGDSATDGDDSQISSSQSENLCLYSFSVFIFLLICSYN
jgi:hypothetical protein